MEKIRSKYFAVCAGLIPLIFVITSCKKESAPEKQTYLQVSIPHMSQPQGSWYQMNSAVRFIELIFDHPVDQATVEGSIVFWDKTGTISGYDIVTSGAMVYLDFRDDFLLKEGWRYFLKIGSGIRSVNGEFPFKEQTLELRTTKRPLGELLGINEDAQNTLAVISDIHMGDSRATTGNYCWFGENADALCSFLDYIQNENQVRELVIQGDLFDEWLIPYRMAPYDPAYGINNAREFYLAVANSPVNQPVIQRLRAIASGTKTALVYIPGNHDMLLTQDVIEEIIPGIQWAGDVPGLGKHNPAQGIIMEHGHRYDFFCCPQPLVNPGHMLPPGYFVSRMYAEGMHTSSTLGEAAFSLPKSSFMFLVAWTGSFIYTMHKFNMEAPPMDSLVVKMTGADGYPDAVSFNGMQEIYFLNDIEAKWQATQQQNGVPVPISVLVALLNGAYLTPAAIMEYLEQSTNFTNYKVVSFGHSHDPGIYTFMDDQRQTKIYANSGSWINDEECSPRKSRTFLIIHPAEWSGSELDVVMLYQYNLSNSLINRQSDYTPELISEASIPDL